MKNNKTRALGLCSGGLDSILSGVILKNQGIEVEWVSFETPFFNSDKAEKASLATGIPLVKEDITDIYMEMLRNPRLGYGKNMNPCRDCHSLMFRLAGQMMENRGFDFLFSGEVLGQRPLSQTKQALRYVDKQSGYSEKILRPLSARALPETDMEKSGLVKRELLTGFSGRSRKPQIELAKELGITKYPSPGGGCLLTDSNFSRRLKDLFEHQEDIKTNEIHLLKYGRHIRLSDALKIIVGRTHGDNQAITGLKDDSYLEIDAVGLGSPTVLVGNHAGPEEVRLAASICLGYTKAPRDRAAQMTVRTSISCDIISVVPVEPGTYGVIL